MRQTPSITVLENAEARRLIVEDAQKLEDQAASDRHWGYAFLGDTAMGVPMLLTKGMRVGAILPAIGALSGLSELSDAKAEEEKAAGLRAGQRAWGNTGLPDRSPRLSERQIQR